MTMTAHSVDAPEIRQLSASVINKIAAGEVIERPASVVKELMENSVDARATRVDVTLEQGGTELIRVSDNGCGIRADQLSLALATHATSKIREADDLFRVATLGFRGEALASIGEVSSLGLRSRVAGEDAGAELQCEGGRRSELRPCGMAPGTTLEVRSLFYNTPVRRKFLRTTQTELGHASEAFSRIALARPDIHFTLRHGQRVVHDLPPVERWRDRIAGVFGAELSEQLIWVEAESSGIRIAGYVADPQHSRSNNRMQYLFLNGRHIRDRSLQHALSEAYRGLLLTGRFPVCMMRLELTPETVDVNVHPTKLEVRFQDGGKIYGLLLGAIRNRFLTSDLTARLGGPAAAAEAAARDSAGGAGGGENSAAAAGKSFGGDTSWARQAPLPLPAQSPSQRTAEVLEQLRQRTGPGGEGAAMESGAPVGGAPAGGAPVGGAPAGGVSPPASTTAPPWPSAGPVAAPNLGSAADRPAGVEDSSPLSTAPLPPSPAAPGFSAGSPPRWEASGMQVHNRYLVTETEEGLVIIDQHALHERILYEQFRAKTMAGQLETQPLLVPEPVTLPPREASAVLEAAETLAQLGIGVEPFGGDTVLVTRCPSMLARWAPREVLRQVVELLMEDGKQPQRRDLLDELLHMMACKAAVKAGDRLTPGEVTALLEHRRLCQDAHHCPHGRPTSLVFTPEELDRRFKR